MNKLEGRILQILKDILKANKEAVEKNDWESVYLNTPEDYRPQLSNLLRELHINPMEYFEDIIPEGFCADDLKLTNVQIPDNIRDLDNYCFSGCLNLARVFLPDSVERIGRFAFANITDLTIHYDGKESDFEDNVIFFNSSFEKGTKIICIDGEVTI